LLKEVCWIAHAGDMKLAQQPGAEVTLDAEVGYHFGTGDRYPENAPMGSAGGTLYLYFAIHQMPRFIPG
jgi:hypothetical protein